MIDIKDNEVETPEEVARRIERAASSAGRRADRVRPSRLRLLDAARSVADAKMRSLVAGRDLFAKGGTD